MKSLNRREWLNMMSILSGTMFLPEWLTAGTKGKKSPTLLVVSGWQDVNIGDIAHTPGLLNILETYLPDAKIILWKKSSLKKEVNRMLRRNFPRVKIIYGNVGLDKTVADPEILTAFDEADMMIHGSGPSVVGMDHLSAWHTQTGKPFGIFGVTIQTISEQLLSLLQKAAFIFTRETAPIGVLKKAGISGMPILFAPDATFLLHIRNDQKALPFLAEKGVEPGKFICAVPRLRYTPYHKIRKTDWSEEKISQVEEINEKYKQVDHAKLREAITAWVRKTDNKVLVCPEMTYEVAIMDELLIDPLPADVKPFVMKRSYCLPDEAASVYARACAVLSFECHSPIIALANKVPAFYLRQPEDTVKGQMYYDLGANDWIFEIDQTSGNQIAVRLIEIVTDPEAAAAKVISIQKNVKTLYTKAIKEIKRGMRGYNSIRKFMPGKNYMQFRKVWILLAVLSGFVSHAQSVMERLKPVGANSGFRMEGYWVWGGSAIKVGSVYHLFASRWPKKSVFPDDYFTESEIVRATSHSPMGPYVFKEVVIGERDSSFWDSNMAHNPTIHKIGDDFVLFYIGSDFTTLRPGSNRLLRRVGYAAAKSIEGPWIRCDQPLISSESNNPAVSVDVDQSVKLIYRDENLVVKIAEASGYKGPYILKNDNVWPGARLEDFYLFRTGGEYHLICEDNQGFVTGHVRWGAHLVSPDGISGWHPANPAVAYDHTLVKQSGDTLHCVRRERPQLLIQKNRITHLFNGVYDGRNSWCQPQILKPPLKLKKSAVINGFNP